MSLKDHITVIVKPTHNCNLRCKYCYIEENAEKGNMPLSLAEEAIKKVSEFSKTSNWIWHGGEPLLMGVDFFKEIQKIQKFYEKKGNEFYNGIQTNGTLINNEILDFIEKANDFDVGLSIDGPEKIHNRTRIYSNGKGSFKKVLKATKSIKERKNQKIG
ncbi:MAG: radical SAM protein, partial [Nanoarchaeota archaeon]|nr:radical SAM protein [Nanoarchaeota archaeon]